jgi:ribosome biogenesis protein BRX1
MGKVKRKAEKAARSVLGAEAAKQLKQTKKHTANVKTAQRATKQTPSVQKSSNGSEALWKHREKPLILCARGITFRYRHLMTDLMQLIPHHKTDSKLDTKHDWNVINEVAELKVR